MLQNAYCSFAVSIINSLLDAGGQADLASFGLWNHSIVLVRLSDMTVAHTEQLPPDLLAVDNSNRVRVYRGTSLVSETLLLGAPSAITTVYLDEKHPIVPAVAVAVGPTLYIYKKLRPFRKYVSPSCFTEKM